VTPSETLLVKLKAIISQHEAEEAARRAQEQRSEELVLKVAKAMAGKHLLEVANAIVDGTLHFAVVIDWSKA